MGCLIRKRGNQQRVRCRCHNQQRHHRCIVCSAPRGLRNREAADPPQALRRARPPCFILFFRLFVCLPHYGQGWDLAEVSIAISHSRFWFTADLAHARVIAQRSLSSMSPKRSSKSAKVAAIADDPLPDEVLVFERVNVDFQMRTLKFICTLRFGSKLLDEYTLGIKFHEAIPQSWAKPGSDAWPIILGLGMACISHVWTGFCTPKIVVKAGYLSPEEVEFWRDAFRLGLCEHLMVNQITKLGTSDSLQVDILVEAACPPSQPPPPPPPGLIDAHSDAPRPRRRVLVPLGGGKDSTTVLEMLKRVEADSPPAIVPFFLGDPEGEYQSCWRYAALCELAGCEPVCIADFWWPNANYNKFCAARKSTQGRNGEPAKKWDDSARLWAAMVAFSSALAASLHDCCHVAVGNERSANLGNGVSWGGVEVNHQHDKSFSFERRAHEYFWRCTRGRLYYFSALMHLWDVQVVETFARICQPYLPFILSCNEPLGLQNSRWCAECEKCAFVYILLGAFLEPHLVMGVFGDDLLQVPSMPLHASSCLMAPPHASSSRLVLTPCPHALSSWRLTPSPHTFSRLLTLSISSATRSSPAPDPSGRRAIRRAAGRAKLDAAAGRAGAPWARSAGAAAERAGKVAGSVHGRRARGKAAGLPARPRFAQAARLRGHTGGGRPRDVAHGAAPHEVGGAVVRSVRPTERSSAADSARPARAARLPEHG